MTTHPSPSLDMIDGESEPRKNMSGIGMMRYIRTAQNAMDYPHIPENNYQTKVWECKQLQYLTC